MKRTLSLVSSSKPLRKPGALYVLFCLAVLVLFVARQIPITADDDYYVEYVSNLRDFDGDWFFALADEPLFMLYTNFSFLILPADVGMRLLIALTLLPHMVMAYLLGGWRAWAYLGGYLLTVELAPHLSWIQLRQGFAVGLLALALHATRERHRAWFAAIAGLIHTSLLILLPCFALARFKNRRWVYLGLAATTITMLALPDFVGLLSFALGRRETAYFGEAATYSPAYILYCLALVVFVTRRARDGTNDDALLVYHAMAAIVLPMFFMTTFGAFAERLYFVARWYELNIIVHNRRANAKRTARIYIGINALYAAYHSIVNFGAGGFLDRYIMLVSP